MGVLLTFDDGLSEHHDYVLPILKELGLWGIFYVPTGPMNTRIMLDVHRVHLLLGRLGGENALKLLGDIIEDYMITVSKEKHATFLKETYKLQDSTPASINFKQTLNYFIGEEHRSEVLTNMIEQTFGTAFPSECENFYLNSGQLLELDKQGMIIGSHGVNHKLMSQLARDKQWNEISESSDYLYEVTGKKVITYCHPYGGLNSFDSTTETLLKAYGIRCSFTVHPGDVTDNQLTATPFALPRFDCNMFPYGAPFASPQFELQKET